MSLSAEQFRNFLDVCCDAGTLEERRAADVALTQDVIERIASSGYSYRRTAGELLAAATGGPRRAMMHFSYFGDASPIFYGNGVRSAQSAAQRSPASNIPRLEPATRRRWIHGWAAPGAVFALTPIHEAIARPDFIIAAGSYTIELDIEVWSASAEAAALIAVELMIDGAIAATYSQPRPDSASATPQHRRTVPLAFATAYPIAVEGPAAIALRNASASDQLARGMLRAVPA